MRGGVVGLGSLAAFLVVFAVGLAPTPVAGSINVCLREAGATGCGPRPPFPVIDGSVRPAKLPKATMAPVAFEVEGDLWPGDPAGMSAVREAVAYVDRQVTLDVEGLSSCGAQRVAALDSDEARRMCHKAIVGRGTATIVLAPVVLARVKVVKRRDGPYSSEVFVRIPPIAAGGGALRSFSFRLERRFASGGERRSYLKARCADGVLRFRAVRIRLRNEVNTPHIAPTTELVGGILAPCTPTG